MPLDELHNDSTSVLFHGLYADAREPIRNGDRMQPANTWGHRKDHRPDLKQLLFTVDFLALLICALIERDLRRALAQCAARAG